MTDFKASIWSSPLKKNHDLNQSSFFQKTKFPLKKY